MLPIKLVKEPHCKGLEAHLAADLCNIKVEYGRGEEIWTPDFLVPNESFSKSSEYKVKDIDK